jgi:dihydrofolate reductase
MKISLIAALARNRVIGQDGHLPWRLPADLKRFRSLTRGHAIIMGRKTWDSLGRPLPERLNIVVSRNPTFQPVGATPAASLDEALALAGASSSPNRSECFVIGGAEIYRLALPLANRLHLTWVELDATGDAWFPEWNRADFREMSRADFPINPINGDAAPAHSFVDYERID